MVSFFEILFCIPILNLLIRDKLHIGRERIFSKAEKFKIRVEAEVLVLSETSIYAMLSLLFMVGREFHVKTLRFVQEGLC